jgi:hypothetical protein
MALFAVRADPRGSVVLHRTTDAAMAGPQNIVRDGRRVGRLGAPPVDGMRSLPALTDGGRAVSAISGASALPRAGLWHPACSSVRNGPTAHTAGLDVRRDLDPAGVELQRSMEAISVECLLRVGSARGAVGSRRGNLVQSIAQGVLAPVIKIAYMSSGPTLARQ